MNPFIKRTAPPASQRKGALTEHLRLATAKPTSYLRLLHPPDPDLALELPFHLCPGSGKSRIVPDAGEFPSPTCLC